MNEQIEQSTRSKATSKRIQLWLYALLCLAIALAIFGFQMQNRLVLFAIYAVLFLIAMQFDHRGIAHSVPTLESFENAKRILENWINANKSGLGPTDQAQQPTITNPPA